nr:MAG TPA: hypothetical protein [Caudoviricetes sp.]
MGGVRHLSPIFLVKTTRKFCTNEFRTNRLNKGT